MGFTVLWSFNKEVQTIMSHACALFFPLSNMAKLHPCAIPCVAHNRCQLKASLSVLWCRVSLGCPHPTSLSCKEVA